MKHRILIDDVALQLGSTGIARYWYSLFENIDQRNLADKYNLEILLLNRSKKLQFKSLKVIDFPDFDFRFAAADRLLISEIARYHDIDVFSSSYYTSCCSKKNLLFVYDFIPEVFLFSNMNRGWLERQVSIINASSYIAISSNTEKDLHKYFPESIKRKSGIAYPGIDRKLFSKPSEVERLEFRERYDLTNYYVTLGSRFGQNGYKNGALLQGALGSLEEFPFDLVYIGGEEIDERDRRIASKLNCKLIRLNLSDKEMVVALGGAEALIYPSLYEGFGMPPLESLAMGIPVICTTKSSIPEATGHFSESIDGTDQDQLASILKRGISSERKEAISKAGPVWAANFQWDKAADVFCRAAKQEAERKVSTREYRGMEMFYEYTEAATFIQTR